MYSKFKLNEIKIDILVNIHQEEVFIAYDFKLRPFPLKILFCRC
jgi:hypothetical protein